MCAWTAAAAKEARTSERSFIFDGQMKWRYREEMCHCRLQSKTWLWNRIDDFDSYQGIDSRQVSRALSRQYGTEILPNAMHEIHSQVLSDSM